MSASVPSVPSAAPSADVKVSCWERRENLKEDSSRDRRDSPHRTHRHEKKKKSHKAKKHRHRRHDDYSSDEDGTRASPQAVEGMTVFF